MAFVLAFVAGFLVWHATRANQARLAIRTRRNQIKTLWGEVRKFAARGIIVLIVFIFLVAVVLKL